MKFAYGVTQVPVVAWYTGHGLALRELANTVAKEKSKGETPYPRW